MRISDAGARLYRQSNVRADAFSARLDRYCDAEGIEPALDTLRRYAAAVDHVASQELAPARRSKRR